MAGSDNSIRLNAYDRAAVIPSGQSTSAAVDLISGGLCGLFIPAGFEGTSIKFMTSPGDGNYYYVTDGSGNDYSVVAVAGKYVPIPDPVAFLGVRYLKLVSSATVAADRTIGLATGAF